MALGDVTVTTDPVNELVPASVDVVVRWLKSVTSISDIVGTRVSTSLPINDGDITYPWLTVGRVVGIAVLDEVPIDGARIQFNSWGGVTNSGAPNWSQADLLIRTVERLIRQTHWVRVEGFGVIESMSGLEGMQQLTDPDTGGARFWMDSQLSVRTDT